MADAITLERPAVARPSALRTVAVLTKARLNSLVAVTVVAGALLAPGPSPAVAVLAAATGVTLAALGACALNQVLERDLDARMRRTRARPLVAGLVGPAGAAALGLGLVALGMALALVAGPLAALLTLLGGGLYVLAYTPLKRVTPLAFLPGALAGALPPVVGWVAAGGALDAGALALGALLLAWQVPHVAAIDWLHREDHARAGLRTLAVVEPTGAATGLAAVLGAGVLLLASLGLGVSGLAPPAAGLLAAALGLPVLALADRLLRERDARVARRLFTATLVHLPCVLGLAVVARST